jgi:hypothetical protein
MLSTEAFKIVLFLLHFWAFHSIYDFSDTYRDSQIVKKTEDGSSWDEDGLATTCAFDGRPSGERARGPFGFDHQPLASLGFDIEIKEFSLIEMFPVWSPTPCAFSGGNGLSAAGGAGALGPARSWRRCLATSRHYWSRFLSISGTWAVVEHHRNTYFLDLPFNLSFFL